jgi:DNA-directed RNA polymerase subunit M/transcription elongation factor TFIIS
MDPLEPSERVTHLIARLDERFDERGNTCNVCGHYAWGWVSETISIDKMETLVFLCPNCGNVRFHAAVVLEHEPPHEPQPPRD